MRPIDLRRRPFLVGIVFASAASVLTACQIRPSPPPIAPTATPVPPVATVAPPVAVESTATSVPSTATPPPTTAPASATPTPVQRSLAWWTTRSDEGWLKAAQEASTRFGLGRSALDAKVTGGHVDFGKIVGAFSSGQSPDVLEPGAFAPLAARGIIRPLDPYLARGGVLATNYHEQMWKNGTWRGQLYGIPALDHGPELGLIWNESLVAGSPPSTWNDVCQFGRRLTRQESGGAIQFLGFDPLDGVGGLLDTARDLIGEDWFDLQTRAVRLVSPAYESFLGSLAAYYSAIGMDHLDEFRGAASPMTAPADAAINQGKQGAILTGYWSVADIGRLAKDSGWKFRSEWAPTTTGAKQVQRVGGLALTIPEVAQHPDDGWELIQFLAGDETNGIFLELAGTFAATRSFVASGRWKQRPGLEFWIDSLDQATLLTSRADNDVASFAQERWEQALADVLVRGKAPADALNPAQTAIRAELRKVNA